jgi:hypothetical protein
MVILLGKLREMFTCPLGSISYTSGETGRLFRFAPVRGWIQLTDGMFGEVSKKKFVGLSFRSPSEEGRERHDPIDNSYDSSEFQPIGCAPFRTDLQTGSIARW